MPVPPPVLSVLLDVEEPRSIHVLAKRNNGSYAAFHKAAHNLADQGIVILRREGKEVTVEAASPSLPGLVGAWLPRTRGEAWSTIFRGDAPTTLHVLHRVGSTALAAQVMGKGRRTIQHLVQQLAPKGILVKQQGGHAIHPRHDALMQLLAEWDRLQAHHRLRALCPGARLFWHLGPDLLFQSHEPPTGDAESAGLDGFARYDIELRTGESTTYYHGKRTLTVADLVLQAFLVEDSARTFGYAALLYEKAKPTDIWQKARLYGLHQKAVSIVEYVHEKPDGWQGFIPWSEHERLRRMYGVGA